MGNNSNEIKGTDHTRIDSETTETDPTLECTTHEGMLLQREEPLELEQRANQTQSSYAPKDEPVVSHQIITITEVEPTPQDTINDIIITPEVMPFSVEQKALAVIPRRLPPAVIRKARKSGMMSTVSGSSQRGKQSCKGKLFIVPSAIVLFFVAISGSHVVLGANADSGNSNTKNPAASFTFPLSSTTTAAVTITPFHSIVNNTYTIAVVTGQPDIAQKQVEGARIITSSQTQSLLVSATGKVTHLL